MPNIYLSEQRIPELEGVTRGAATIVLHEPKELEGLQSLCLLSGVPFQDPTVGIFHALASLPTPASSTVDLEAWNIKRRRLRAELPNWQSVGPADGHDETEQIVAALGMAREMWSSQGTDVSNLSLLFAVPDPAHGNERHVDLQGENPGWMLVKGSLRSRLFLGAFKTGGFVIAILSKRGIGVEKRADDIMAELRAKQLERNDPRVEHLPSLADAKRDEFADKCGVIIFLHGLLSTDLGTFDALLRLLRERSFDKDSFAFLGWAHDTLTQIAYNADELCEKILKVFPTHDNGQPKIAFVCHSRGGLLARYAAAQLRKWDKDNRNRWGERIAGCVTFGTPHLGTGLADAPDELIACLLAAQVTKATRQLPPLSDVLWIAKQNKTLEGVEDLRTFRGKLPSRRTDSFQKTLRDLEREVNPDGGRLLDVLAIGGRVDSRSKWYYDLARRALGDVDNDVAVPLDSSRPETEFRGLTSDGECDHFSYFTDEEVKKEHYGTVADYLMQVLDWNGCKSRTRAAIAVKHPPPLLKG